MNQADTTSQSAGFTIEDFADTVTVSLSDAIIASSDKAKILREQGHEPVFYIPFEDIYFEFMEKTGTSTRCPLKGTASYWRATAVGESANDAMWAYEIPIPQAAAIARHGAFYPDRVRVETVAAEDHEEATRLV